MENARCEGRSNHSICIIYVLRCLRRSITGNRARFDRTKNLNILLLFLVLLLLNQANVFHTAVHGTQVVTPARLRVEVEEAVDAAGGRISSPKLAVRSSCCMHIQAL